MKYRVSLALLSCCLLHTPIAAAAQDDEEESEEQGEEESGGENEAESEEEEESGDEEPSDGEEGGGSLDDLMTGARSEDKPTGSDGDDGDGFDEIEGMDDERPPGDPDAFVQPKEEEPKEAEDDGPDSAFTAGVVLGYGVAMEDVNPFGFGFGARLGYDLGLFSLSGEFLYFVGETIDMVTYDSFNNQLGSSSFSRNVWQVGIDAGLDIEFSRAVALRPFLGIGFATVSGQSANTTEAYFSPGVSLLYAASDALFMQLDARYEAISASWGGVLILAGMGMRI